MDAPLGEECPGLPRTGCYQVEGYCSVLPEQLPQPEPQVLPEPSLQEPLELPESLELQDLEPLELLLLEHRPP